MTSVQRKRGDVKPPGWLLRPTPTLPEALRPSTGPTSWARDLGRHPGPPPTQKVSGSVVTILSPLEQGAQVFAVHRPLQMI